MLSIVQQRLESPVSISCAEPQSHEDNVLITQYSTLVPVGLRQKQRCLLASHHYSSSNNREDGDLHQPNCGPSPITDGFRDYDCLDWLWQDWSVLSNMLEMEDVENAAIA